MRHNKTIEGTFKQIEDNYARAVKAGHTTYAMEDKAKLHAIARAYNICFNNDTLSEVFRTKYKDGFN